jgi:hypothetical protein
MANEDQSLIPFVCIENASGKRMEEDLAEVPVMNALSACSVPAAHLNSLVVKSMSQKGIGFAERVHNYRPLHERARSSAQST